MAPNLEVNQRPSWTRNQEDRLQGRFKKRVLLRISKSLRRRMYSAAGYGDDRDRENRDGQTVKVRVALNTERLSLPTDTPSKEDMRYLEAIFREQGTGRYYTGSAEIGESRIMVSVPSGKTYDILVLAGTPADGNVTTGLRCSWQAAWFRHIRLSTARTP